MSSSPSLANPANPFTCSPVTAPVPAMEPSEPAQPPPRLSPAPESQEKSTDNNVAAVQAASVKSDEKGFTAAGEKLAWTAPTKAMRGARRGRPPLGRRSRGARLKLVNVYKEHNGWVAVKNGDDTPHDGADQGVSRGRTRARGKNRGGRPRIHPLRGSGRATKRRRGDSDEDDGGTEKYDTDATENFSPLPAQSRSGRKIFKATTFTPVGIEATRGEDLPGPGGGLPRKRRRRGMLNSICRNCGRGPSPERNMIVYCDDCDAAWHQHCHDPPVSLATVRAEQEQWFCADCETAREEKQRLVGKISAEGMSLAEVRFCLFRTNEPSIFSLHSLLPSFSSLSRFYLAIFPENSYPYHLFNLLRFPTPRNDDTSKRSQPTISSFYFYTLQASIPNSPS